MEQVVFDVNNFMLLFGQTVRKRNEEQAELYISLIDEEYSELADAETDEDCLDAICDLIWVLVGLGSSLGYDVAGAWQEVVDSNMSKLGENGRPIIREDGKIMKGPNYFRPSLTQFIGK